MNDLISRQEVLNKLNELDQQDLYLPCHFKDFVLDEVSSVPQKTGRWIVDALANNIYRCSECGIDAPVELTGGTEYKSNYCPNCGAKMEGETE